MPTTPFPPSDHCDGYRFHNPGMHVNRSWLDVWRWKRNANPADWPKHVAINPPPLPARPTDDSVVATWIGHATTLLQSAGANVLIDPVFSERASPVSWAGPTRVHPPGVALTDLPPIDLVLLSHDHYDHCDGQTLRRLSRTARPPHVLCPLGNGSLLLRFGFPTARITELDWWQEHTLAPGVSVQATPARHWSNRLSGARNGRLWSGFWLRLGQRTLYYAGDTAWDDHLFADIRKRCGAPDLALLPIGAYEPRWFMSAQHCNPTEAVRIHQTLGARQSIGVHWGTFQLTDEGREEPLQALAEARHAADVADHAFVTLDPGGSLTV